jgi:hypothetical protein
MGIPLPALQVQNNQQSPLDTYAKILGIKNEQAQQALIPGQVQAQQQQLQAGQQAIQGGAIDLQQKQIALNDQKLLMGIYQKHASGGSATTAQPAADGSVAAPREMPTVDLQSNIGSMIQDAMDQGVSPQGINSLLNFQKTQLDVANQAATLDKNTRDNIQAKNTATWNAAETLRAIPEGTPERAQAYQGTLQNLQQQGVDTSKFPQQVPSNAQLDQIEAPLAMINGAIELGTKKAQETSAAQAADPVLKLSTPEALAAPGAQASIQALINDPKTKPSDVPRLQALLPKAAVAQQQAVVQKQREDLASQAVSQGDPNAAGKLLASRALTIDELKLRQATPQFIESAVEAAQKIDPTFKAAEAAAQANIAKAPANQQFFGNTDSLLTSGGTLDQLSKAAQALPQGQIPVFNKVENLVKTATGQGPQAAYAASILGVADDYAKVMGGAVGTDTARQQIMQRLDAAQSPEQKQAVINQFRQQITSQRAGRIGSNPYLRDMYPAPGGAQGGGPQAGGGNAAGQASPGAKFQVGQQVSIKGKPMTITAVHSDGSFDAK